jgi:hypothetical protein
VRLAVGDREALRLFRVHRNASRTRSVLVEGFCLVSTFGFRVRQSSKIAILLAVPGRNTNSLLSVYS